jgi:uncharacterized protein (TIGR00266 family)
MSDKPSANIAAHTRHQIIGDDIQTVVMTLQPQETIVAEAGTMNWMDQHIGFETKMGDGSEANQNLTSKLLNVGKRFLTGESLFMTHFTNNGSADQQVAFAAPYPGKIIQVDLSQFDGHIQCQKDAFLCAELGTKVDIAFQKKLGTGLFGGEGFILQKLTGDKIAYLHACGTIIKRELKGETIKVDTGCLVGFTDGINYNIERAGNLKSMVFGGEGLFLATLQGTGTVWLQSLPFSRMAKQIVRYAPQTGGRRQGEGSVLGTLGDLIDGT